LFTTPEVAAAKPTPIAETAFTNPQGGHDLMQVVIAGGAGSILCTREPG
jgi:hypothetical protein